MDEPSKPRPSANSSSVSSFSGVEKCCQVPGRSVNLTSTTCTPASFARRIASEAVVPVAGFAPWAVLVGSNVAAMSSLSSTGLGGWGTLHGRCHERRAPGDGLGVPDSRSDLARWSVPESAEPKGAVAWCQPFCVHTATERNGMATWTGLDCTRDGGNVHKLHSSRSAEHYPSSVSRKCHSSTAENSPKRSCTFRSDHSRKTQVVA